jgi:hypothetical protein
MIPVNMDNGVVFSTTCQIGVGRSVQPVWEHGTLVIEDWSCAQLAWMAPEEFARRLKVVAATSSVDKN